MPSEPVQIPEVVQRKMDLCRDFVGGRLTGLEFETAFLRARTEEIRSAARTPRDWSDPMHQVFYSIDDFVADNCLAEGELREPGELDEEQLREAVRHQLHRIDTGDVAPYWEKSPPN